MIDDCEPSVMDPTLFWTVKKSVHSWNVKISYCLHPLLKTAMAIMLFKCLKQYFLGHLPGNTSRFDSRLSTDTPFSFLQYAAAADGQICVTTQQQSDF